MMVNVKSAKGTSKWPDPLCRCDNWLKHWYINMIFVDADYAEEMIARTSCPLCGKPITNKNPLVGAHVQKTFSDDRDYYIIPVCKSCNSSGNFSFKVDDKYLVSMRKEDCKREILNF